ncbi:MAG: hypothetical protein IPM16_17610 [Chloroflexi bacterium]|nr:hypothetical protein [Chloroflexota bacterium]
MNDLKPIHLAILDILSLKPRAGWYGIAIRLPKYDVELGTDLIADLRFLEKEGLITRFPAVNPSHDEYELTPRGASIVQQHKS